MGFTQTTHDKCIYHANINGNTILILRQVDDIAIASPGKKTADKIIEEIGKYMKNEIKNEVLLKLYNGLDVSQTEHYTKIHCTAYLNKVEERHQHWITDIPPTNGPLPMVSDNSYIIKLEMDGS